MPGHLFIVRGDITQLNCDAWLLPTDRHFQVESGWLESLPGKRPARPVGWPVGVRSLPWENWRPDYPQPWLTNVGSEGKPLDWFVKGACEFVRATAAALEGQTSRGSRSRPIVALPLVGTGRGGARLAKGGVVSLLIPALREELRTLNVDAALVVNTPAALAACQGARGTNLASWSDLTESEHKLGKKLAEHAKNGHLALFFGSGVSSGAGLPQWQALIDQLGKGAHDPDYTSALSKMTEVDQAQVLAQGQDKLAFRTAVAKIIDQKVHYSLTHGLLAGLPHREAVTPNYDRLFEKACAAAGEPVTVLPYEALDDGRRWLLKMHGCTSSPKDIVLTREDFLRYRNQRGALAGVVQSLLLTRHLLVVGFSLRDDNFVAIVDDVRRVVEDVRKPGPGREKLGTALLLESAGPLRDLWRSEIEIASLQEPRRLEIFLDLVLSYSTEKSRHLLDETFASFLTGPEKKLRDKLDQLGEVPDEVRAVPAWREVEKLLSRLGKSPRES